MRNVHERALPVPTAQVGALIDQLASPDDALWPAPAWPPLRFDRPLGIGADGGHGSIRYHVTAYEPGRHVEFTFHRAIGVTGFHTLTVEPVGDDRCVLRHVAEGSTHGAMVLGWPLVIRWLHDALIEDLLDNAELAVTGVVARPARWSPWVRFLRGRLAAKPRAVPTPEEATLVRAVFARTDLADAWQVPLPDGVTSDPVEWAETTFGTPPGWVTSLLGLRNALVRLGGIEPGDRSAFAIVDRTAHEALLGTDAGHLDFRASVLVADGTVTLTTVARACNTRGRLYLAVVRLVHPAVVRAMLSRAAQQLAARAPAAPTRTSATR